MRIVFPHRSIVGAVSTASGLDATYSQAWLTDGRPGYPVRKTSGDLSASIALAASTAIDVLAITHHSVREAATITIGGDISTTIPTAALPADGIPLNFVRLLETPIDAEDLTLAVTGNTDPIIIGEFYAGLSTEILLGFRHGRGSSPGAPAPWEGEYGVLPPYDAGVSTPRSLHGDFLFDPTEYADFLNSELGQCGGSKAVLVLPDDDVNDAWLAQITITETTDGYNHFVTVDIVEIRRMRLL